MIKNEINVEKNAEILSRLKRSGFRKRFVLKDKDLDYIKNKGLDLIKEHAFEIIIKRIAPAFPDNDGKQTPMKNHPVFIAQHATATCCRGCIEKWHGFPKGVALERYEIVFIVNLIMDWINLQINDHIN